MKKPIIGITLDNEEKDNYSKFPWYAIRKNYLHCIEKYGGIPFPLYHSKKFINEIFSKLDSVIITGGNFDIDPGFYGKSNNDSRIIKNQRTKFEIEICKLCIEKNKPILGICGGAQLINICLGGTLIQDIKISKINPIEHEQKNPRNETSHKVNLFEKTKIFAITKKLSINVNSAHHQSIDKLGKNLLVSGKAPDGIIESIENSKHTWCIGVQWHPEFLITEEDNLLIKDFVKHSAK